MEKIFKLFLSSSGMWKPAPRIITSQRGIMFPLLEFRNQKDKCPTEVSPAWSSKKWRPDVASWMFITIILTSHVLLALRFSHGERKKVTFFKDCLQHSLISFYQKSTQRIKNIWIFAPKHWIVILVIFLGMKILIFWKIHTMDENCQKCIILHRYHLQSKSIWIFAPKVILVILGAKF